ncbi:hypothetical protein AK812_SmicGene29087 [Symbiodinium microadriaticum]|uniref:Uncharacterized protein n=1 Tax=Symbiodinium microadriaticum TaxID=2951 RepID=A0A1Q9D2T8_SYMMI|nr:hypothetical protein AK812_SmicGene29087 [Symbiodinium microadriaticum]
MTMLVLFAVLAVFTCMRKKNLAQPMAAEPPGRSFKTAYALAAVAPEAPEPAPYPVQRGLTAAMRTHAAKEQSLDGMMAWAGQSARLSKTSPAATLVQELWSGTQDILGVRPASKY